MFTEARKLSIIEAIIKSRNESLLADIERLVKTEDSFFNKPPDARFSELVGVLTPDEAESMKRIIEDNFENVEPDDWR